MILKKESNKNRSSGRIVYFYVFVLYLAAALIIFYPVALHIKSYVPGTGSDVYQNLWDIWWVNYATFSLHTSAFHTSILFWPLGANLAYSTLAPLLGIISAPLQLFGTVFAYNIIFFLGFVASGISMFVLARYLVENNYAAAIAGFVFTFSAFHIAKSFFIHYIFIGWAPLFLYFMLKLVHKQGKDYINVIGMSISFALSTLMGNIEQTIMIFLLFVFAIAAFLVYKKTRSRILSRNFVYCVVIFFVVAFILGSWNFVPLFKAALGGGGLSTANYLNNLQHNEYWSINPLAFFVPSYLNGIFYKAEVSSTLYIVYFPDPIEKVGYIGITVLFLVAIAIGNYKKKMLPWVAGAAIFILLSMGPILGLYELYHAVPGLNIIREPGRFDLIAEMFVSVLAAWGSKALFENSQRLKKSRSWSILVFSVIIVLMFVENNAILISNSPKSFTNITVPKFYGQISNASGNFSVLELPAVPEDSLYSGEATFYTSITRKPLVGGYIGRVNNTDLNWLADISSGNYTNNKLYTLANYNVRFVILQKAAFNGTALAAAELELNNTFGNPVYNDSHIIAYNTSNALGKLK